MPGSPTTMTSAALARQRGVERLLQLLDLVLAADEGAAVERVVAWSACGASAPGCGAGVDAA